MTPYVESVERRIIANYRAIGIEVGRSVRRDLTSNTAFGRIDPIDIVDMVRKAAVAPVDAMLIRPPLAISPSGVQSQAVADRDSHRVENRHRKFARGAPA